MTIAGKNACVHRNVPVALTASRRFQSASVILASGALWAAPALLTRMLTTPARRAAACTRLWTLAASVTSHRTAHALPPPSRISAATFSIGSALRAATTIAAPSAASARATAAPMPWPPPVTTATEPSNLRNYRLLEDRTQRIDQPGPFFRARRGGVAKVRARPSRCFERALAEFYRLRNRAGIGRERAPDRVAHELRLRVHHDRAFEPAGVAGAALEFVAQTRAPSPRPACDIWEDDRQQAICARELDRFVQGRQVFGIEMRIGNRQELEALLGEAARKIDHDCGDGNAGDGQRARERGRKARRGVRERRQDEDRAPLPPSVGCEFACPVARHRRRDHDVGVERQMRSMRLDRTDRQHDDGAGAVEIAHFFPGELRQLMYRHHHPFS